MRPLTGRLLRSSLPGAFLDVAAYSDSRVPAGRYPELRHETTMRVVFFGSRRPFVLRGVMLRGFTFPRPRIA